MGFVILRNIFTNNNIIITRTSLGRRNSNPGIIVEISKNFHHKKKKNG